MFYNIYAEHIYLTGGQSSWTISENLFMLDGANTFDGLIQFQGSQLNSTFDNNIFVGSRSASGGALCFGNTNVFNTWTGNEFHGHAANAIYSSISSFADIGMGTLSGGRAYRNAVGLSLTAICRSTGLVFDGMTLFGNSSEAILLSGTGFVLKNLVVNAGTTLTQPLGILLTGFGSNKLHSCTFGATTAHATADLQVNTGNSTFGGVLEGCNCTFASATEFTGTASVYQGAILSLKHDGSAATHKVVLPNGRSNDWTGQTDTAIYSGASPSFRLYPGSTPYKLRSNIWHAAVASGQTLTPSIKVRESVVGDGTDYNGARIRLIVLANPAAGIGSDTVLATATIASEGAFETISGTTAAVTEDAVLEFAVDCDGTTGWINVDEFSCISVDPGGMNHWQASAGGPGIAGVPASGGGGLVRHPGMCGGLVA